MNRHLVITMAVLLGIGVILFFAFTDKKSDTILTKEGPIIIFGDSLVYGIGATPGNDIASVLESRLGVPVINAGRPGETTESAKSRLVSDVIVKEPGIVVMILGGNDKLRRVPKEETLQNIRYLLTEIRNSGASVVLVGISNMVYSRDYENIAQELNIPFIPRLLDETLGNKALMSDAVHPNDAGYLIFADKIEEQIRILQGLKR